MALFPEPLLPTTRECCGISTWRNISVPMKQFSKRLSVSPSTRPKFNRVNTCCGSIEFSSMPLSDDVLKDYIYPICAIQYQNLARRKPLNCGCYHIFGRGF